MPRLVILGLLMASAQLGLPPRARAQADRFTVGQHLRAFERAWDKYGTSATARQRTIAPLFNALRNFFAARWSDSAKDLDDARHALESATLPSAEVRWAESLYLSPSRRLLDASANELPLSLRPFYKVETKVPESARVRLTLFSGGKALMPAWEQGIVTPPHELRLPLKGLAEGDHTLKVEILVAGKILAQEESTFSIVTNAKQRLAAVRREVSTLKSQAKTTDSLTLRELIQLLEGLADGRTYETNYPAARLLAEAEGLVKALQAGKGYYGKDRIGQFWLNLATSKGQKMARVFVPEAARQGKPLPLVVALHGAGGSENLFFEAYGHGAIVELCKKRGWLLVAPRSPPLAFKAPVAAIVEEVARIYPVDRTKVFVVGHSMGAAQGLAAVQENPECFAAVALLGGSGPVTGAGKIKAIPIFIGVGDRDFAKEGAKRMADLLREEGVQTVGYREYPVVEHITIVQTALPDVFAVFDGAAKK